MKVNSQKVKKLLLIIMIVGLIAPFFQDKLELFKIRKLDGSFNKVEKPEINKKAWFDGSFQVQYQKYIEENIGWRNFLVRLNNQISFWLFDKINAKGVVLGKQNFLFEQDYIDSYFGTDFIGDSLIRDKGEKLSFISKMLTKKNIDLLVVIAPNKADYYSEYIPNKYDKKIQEKRNYQKYLSEFKKKGIQYIDFNKYFKSLKETTPYPLFTKGGIHWSNYGELIAGDSILGFISKIKNAPVNRMVFKDNVVTTRPKKSDNDIEKGMNLLFRFDYPKLAYPNVEYTKGEKIFKIKSLNIADSFFWGLYNENYTANALGDGEFWYYSEKIYKRSLNGAKEVDSLSSIKREVEKNNTVIILLTESKLNRFAFGFVDALYEEYYMKNGLNYEERIERVENIILKDKNWLQMVKKLALEKGNSLELEIRLNAEYMVDNE